jgi:hypothetical protein
MGGISSRRSLGSGFPSSRGVAMTKLSIILAGSLLAAFTQFATAQTGAGMTTNPSDPAYTDQSRLNQSNDPYVKKRVATKQAKEQYKADKKAAKSGYKEEKADAKDEYKDAKKDARETRKEELKETGR